MLTEAAQGDREVSQETSTANERYLVSKVRLELVQDRIELQQFDYWDFGRQLAYARGPQDDRVPDEVRDPLQDRHKDPWTQTKVKLEQEVVRKPSGPQVYDMTPPSKSKRFSRLKKNQKKTYMMSVEGHLKDLYQRLDNEYNQAHDNPEEDSGIDTGSEGDRSSSTSWQQLGATWKKTSTGEGARTAVQSGEDSTAQTFAITVPDGPPGLDDVSQEQDECKPDDLQSKYRAQEDLSPEQEVVRRDLRHQEKREKFLRRRQEPDSPPRTKAPPSPEATTPETEDNCRKCGHTRTEAAPYCCQCGQQYVDGSGNLPDKRTALMLDTMGLLTAADEDAILPLTIDPESMRPESLPLNAAWKDESDPEWIRLRTVMDSGAADNVGPPSMAPMVPTVDSPGSLRGQAYLAAGGERIHNLGQQTLNVVTNEGHKATTVYQIAEVTRPLTAVGATCDKGNFVVYGPGGGCIYNLTTGIQTNFSRRGGIYELDLWMKTNNGDDREQPQGFPWQGL